MSRTVHLINQSTDEDGERPDGVTYYDPQGEFKRGDGFKRFQTNCCICAGKEGYSQGDWFTPQLYASRPGATPIENWDYYLCATFGAFSQKAIDSLLPFFGDRFVPLPATLEGTPYFCLCCKRRVDCLDTSRSDIVYFDGDAGDVMKIDRYTFSVRDVVYPSVFAIPQLVFRLFCTDPVPEMVAAAGLTGFEFARVYNDSQN